MKNNKNIKSAAILWSTLLLIYTMFSSGSAIRFDNDSKFKARNELIVDSIHDHSFQKIEQHIIAQKVPWSVRQSSFLNAVTGVSSLVMSIVFLKKGAYKTALSFGGVGVYFLGSSATCDVAINDLKEMRISNNEQFMPQKLTAADIKMCSDKDFSLYYARCYMPVLTRMLLNESKSFETELLEEIEKTQGYNSKKHNIKNYLIALKKINNENYDSVCNNTMHEWFIQSSLDNRALQKLYRKYLEMRYKDDQLSEDIIKVENELLAQLQQIKEKEVPVPAKNIKPTNTAEAMISIAQSSDEIKKNVGYILETYKDLRCINSLNDKLKMMRIKAARTNNEVFLQKAYINFYEIIERIVTKPLSCSVKTNNIIYSSIFFSLQTCGQYKNYTNNMHMRLQRIKIIKDYNQQDTKEAQTTLWDNVEELVLSMYNQHYQGQTCIKRHPGMCLGLLCGGFVAAYAMIKNKG